MTTHLRCWLTSICTFLLTYAASASLPTQDPDSLLQILPELEGEDRVQALYTIGHKSLLNDLALAKKYADSARSTSKALGINSWDIGIDNLYGSYHFQQGDYDSALFYYRGAQQLARKSAAPKALAQCHNLLGSFYYRQSEYEAALKEYIRAAQILDSIGYNYGSAVVYNNVSAIYNQIHNDSASLVYLDAAFRAGEKANDPGLIAATLLNMSSIYMGQERYDTCVALSDRAAAYARQSGEKSALASVYLHQGTALLRIEQPDSALSRFRQGIALYRELDWELRIGIGQIGLADAFLHLSPPQPDSALPYLERGEATLENLQDHNALIDVYRVRALYHEKKKDPAEALHFTRKAHQLEDSLKSSQNTARLQELQTRFESTKKQRRIEQLEYEATVNAWRERMLASVLIGVLIVIVLIGILLRIRHKKNRELSEQRERLMRTELENSQLKAQELKQELEFKERQLTTHTLHLSQKNEMLEKFREELQELRSKAPSAVSRDLGRIEKQVQRFTNTERDWEEFRIHFESVNKHFFQQLKDHFPDLTSKELRLCALIRLNLSLKEAANILSIAPESVKTARYRLRKKFGLDTQTNLNDFLMKY